MAYVGTGSFERDTSSIEDRITRGRERRMAGQAGPLPPHGTPPGPPAPEELVPIAHTAAAGEVT